MSSAELDAFSLAGQLMNILQTCYSPAWGGLEIQALEVCLRLLRRGHQVTLSCQPGTRLAHEAAHHNVPLLPHAVRGYIHPIIVIRLATQLRRGTIDLIHCQHSRDIATVVPAMLLSGRRRPILLSKRVGSYINKKDIFHRLTHRYISRILAISDVIHRNVLETLPIPPERVLTLHDAIDTARFSSKNTHRSTIRHQFSIDDTTLLVGFVGRCSPGKGHEEFLRAAAILKPRFPDVRYLAVGEASYGEEQYAARIRRLAVEFGVDDVVTFVGFREDIPDIMAAFDVFAFPSHAEAFGVVLIEAMAMELPVVSTNCDGVLDIVVEGETGLMVPPRNAEEFARCLGSLLEDPVLRRQLGKAGRVRVLNIFDQQKQITRLEQIYRDLLSDASQTSR
jgi:glycosyltransferase involved in cell wall biosynthesis